MAAFGTAACPNTHRFCAAGPSGLHVDGHAVKPYGKSSNRIAGRENAVPEEITRSSPDGSREFLPQSPLGAGPRTARQMFPRLLPALRTAARGPADGNGNSARGGTSGPAPSSASAALPANAATGAPPDGTPRCNTGPDDAAAETAARTPSINTAGTSSIDKGLALPHKEEHSERDPRE